VGDPLDSELRGEVDGDVMRIIIAYWAVVGSCNVAFGWIDGDGQFLKGYIALPLVLPCPSGNRKPTVYPRADRYASSTEIAHVSIDIGEEQIVTWIYPLTHGIY
jgi:hypothetical protein